MGVQSSILLGSIRIYQILSYFYELYLFIIRSNQFSQLILNPFYSNSTMQAQSQQKHIKVLLCQLKPILKQKKDNIKRVSVSLKTYTAKDKIDVILLPEMSFTGYNFEDKQDAMPMAIKYADQKSPEFHFAIDEAKRLKCYVIFGYMEVEEKDGEIKLYNSAAVVDRTGKPILNYRKTHLYYNDQLWCKQGSGFTTLEIKNTQGQTFKAVLGICMDINPKHFTSGQYEWSDFAIKNEAQILLFLTNWVDSQADSVQDSAVVAMYNYWLHRMRPLISVTSQGDIKPPVLFFAADRVGQEYSFYDKKNTHFFGSSCAIHLNPPYVIQKLSKLDEGYLMIESKLPKQRVYLNKN